MKAETAKEEIKKLKAENRRLRKLLYGVALDFHNSCPAPREWMYRQLMKIDKEIGFYK